jgi:predicted PurR-regulated permease PerM
MYGIIGGALILFFLLKPLFRWNEKREYIKNWEPVSLGYILFLVICGSNPYLINSTGLICIIFMYSYIANDKYCKQTIDYQ